MDYFALPTITNEKNFAFDMYSVDIAPQNNPYHNKLIILYK